MDLAVPHEAPKLLLEDQLSLSRLLLESPERAELAFSVDDPLHGEDAECPDQFVFQISIAHEEAQRLHLGTGQIRAHTRTPSRARANAPASPASQRPASRTPSPRGPNRSRKAAIACEPPIGTTAIPSASRFRLRRLASAVSARWSLMPSTSTTARGSDGSVTELIFARPRVARRSVGLCHEARGYRSLDARPRHQVIRLPAVRFTQTSRDASASF